MPTSTAGALTFTPSRVRPQAHRDRDLLVLFELWLFERWTAYIKSVTGRTVIRSRRVNIKEAYTAEGYEESGIGRYLTKVAHGWGVTGELTGGKPRKPKGSR